MTNGLAYLVTPLLSIFYIHGSQAITIEGTSCTKSSDCGLYSIIVTCDTRRKGCVPYRQTLIPCENDEHCKIAMNGTMMEDYHSGEGEEHASVECNNKRMCQCRPAFGIDHSNRNKCTKIQSLIPIKSKKLIKELPAYQQYAPVFIVGAGSVVLGTAIGLALYKVVSVTQKR